MHGDLRHGSEGSRWFAELRERTWRYFEDRCHMHGPANRMKP
jgi:hypothetical protein